MNYLGKLNGLLSRHRTDESGSISLPFALSMLTIVTAVGATYDVNQVQTSAMRSQQIADMIGLTATVYVKNHGKPPQSDKEGFVHNKTYSAKEMGFNAGAATSAGNDVKFKVSYDAAKAQATVTMKGQIQTSFMGMFGKDSIPFDSESVVKYAKSDIKDPATVILVMDNSGSMAWDDKPKTSKYGPRPAGAQARIVGLKKTVLEFNTYLGKSVEANTSGKTSSYLRMGMTAYNSSLISARTVVPAWGTLPPSKISQLSAGGGTDSRQSMQKAFSWMQGEDAQHKRVNDSKKPLKYVIFMSDGVNNQEYVCDWKDQKNTRYWRAIVNGNSYYWSGRQSSPYPGATEGVRYNCRYERNANKQTLNTCTKLKNSGVEIYTIGYALTEGTYATKPPSSQYTTTQSVSSRDIAYNFLESCASGKGNFVKAEDTDALKKAFDKIGADIIADSIRVAS